MEALFAILLAAALLFGAHRFLRRRARLEAERQARTALREKADRADARAVQRIIDARR